MNKSIVLSVMVGIAAFGATIYLVKRLPSGNIVTDTVKKAASVATTS